MFLLKKYSVFLSVVALIFLADLCLYELVAVGADADHSKVELALKYPLTTEGALALKTDTFERRDETLLQELVDRYETEQVVLSAEELEAVSMAFKRLAKCYSADEKFRPDFSRAAEYYLKAEKLGDSTTREAYYGLPQKVEIVCRSSARKAHFEKLIPIYFNDPHIRDPEFYVELAKMLSANGAYSNLSLAAECYLKAIRLGNPVAREAYYGLFEKANCQSQVKELTEIYLREAEKQDIDFLKKIVQLLIKEFSSDNSGRIAQCYLKIAELGDPTGKSEFYGLLERFNKIFTSNRSKAAKYLFPICLQEVGKDERVNPLLEKNYGDGYFLNGVFSYYIKKGDAASIKAAFGLYDKYRVIAQLGEFHTQPLTEHLSVKVDAGDLEACHQAIEMFQDFNNYGKAAQYYVKARALGDTQAREGLHQLLKKFEENVGKLPHCELRDVASFCVEEIDKGDEELKPFLMRNYQYPTFLAGVFSYYMRKGDGPSVEKALTLYNIYKATSKLEPSDLKELREYFIPKADGGDVEACRKVIEMSKGFGRQVRYDTAIEYYIKAIKLGDPEAREGLHRLVENASLELSEQTFSKAIVQSINEQADAQLFFLLGNAYARMRFYFDLTRSASYYFKALALGHPQVKEALNVPLNKLKKLDPKDRKQYADEFVASIFPLYAKEAEKDEQLCKVLADEYLSGTLVEKDIAKAVNLYIQGGRLAGLTPQAIHSDVVRSLQTQPDAPVVLQSIYEAEERKPNADSLGSMLLAELYLARYGDEVRPNRTKAESYYKKAEVKGDATFHMAFARMYAKKHSYFDRTIDVPKAAEHYLKAETLGHPEARRELYNLGSVLHGLKGKEEKSYQFKAFADICKREAERDPSFYIVLGNMYVNSLLYRDYEHAAEYFLQAENLGVATARENFLGLVTTLKDLPEPERKVQAQKLSQICKKNAERGGIQPFSIRAELSEMGGDDGKAMEYYLKAAHQGDTQAYKKAWDYYCAVSSSSDAPMRLSACIEGIETEEDNRNPHAAYLRGTLLFNDFIGQMECYTNAAKWGHPDAWSAAGNCYVETVKRAGISRGQLKMAFSSLLAHYLQCAKHGDETLFLNIADMYEREIGDDPDRGNLAEWYGKEVARLSRLAATGDENVYQAVLKLREDLKAKPFTPEQKLRVFKPLFELELQNAKENIRSAQVNVGGAYISGCGVVRDVEQAAFWFLKAKSKIFYRLYDFSKNNPDELKKLFPLYLAEAEKGDYHAQYLIGKMYFKHRGIEKNVGEARKWFTKALGKLDKAAYRLGQLYELGDQNTEPNLERAFDYYKKSKSKKCIAKYIKRSADVDCNCDRKFDYTGINVAFSEFYKLFTQSSILSHSAQSDLVKGSPLGKTLAEIEEAAADLSKIVREDLKKKRVGFLMTAVAANQTIPKFIETFEVDGMTYVSVGKDNCELAERIRLALSQFKKIEKDVDQTFQDCSLAICNNSPKLMTLAALAIEDKKSQQKYVHLSKAQEKLDHEKRRLMAYGAACKELKNFLNSSAHRNADFFDDKEFGFLK
ncbi:MAG: hypothetical protein K2P93_09000 [Alphaproteobacteria bacterium]|nr:hypothetical protein [Alphaproteobacteria bacterium]